MNIIETQDLKVRYGTKEALRGLSLAVPEGAICALIGSNGAGKTTAIKVLMNLLRPTAGRAQVLGVDSRRLGPPQLAQIGYVSENQQLPLWMTVRQLLDFCRPWYPTWDPALEAQLVRTLELPEDRRLKDLSRGMLMKATLIASLAYRPKLLVLDEPFSGLDVFVREQFIDGLLQVIGAGEWTVLVSSHDLDEVERLADTIAFVDNGRLRFTESTDSMLRRFRRIEGRWAAAGAERPPPAGLLGWQQEGTAFRYIESGFTAETLEALPRGAFPGARLQATPMSLREIFVAIFRESRNPDEKLTS